jgi:hypothetical protein
VNEHAKFYLFLYGDEIQQPDEPPAAFRDVGSARGLSSHAFNEPVHALAADVAESPVPILGGRITKQCGDRFDPTAAADPNWAGAGAGTLNVRSRRSHGFFLTI